MSGVDARTTALDWQHLPLDGRVLIEASAGTGKTFTIGLIYLRLLLERGLRIEQILVATFTEAAAMELRERLRARLVEVERLLRESVSPDADGPEPDSLAAWIDGVCADADSRRVALRKIQLARADFDRAAIATIHGLCARIQRDYPLQTGAGFAADTLIDETELLRECIEDFWRLRYLGGSVDPREADVVLSGGPEGLLHDLKSLMSRAATPVPADGLAQLDRGISELKTLDNIAELRKLADDKSLYAPRKSALSNHLRKLADALEAGDDLEDALAEILEKHFDSAAIAGQQPESPSFDLRTHPLVVQLQRLRDLLKRRKVFVRGAVVSDALKFCREQLPLRAQRRNAQTYSMQIETVHARLHADDSTQLADCLFAAFPVALIDEFQDTDEHQFRIFDRIYKNAAGQTRGLLAMIGDPKQAIFGFRGGDIATYLRTSAKIAQRHSLDVNYRSGSALIGALNALYKHTDGGFDNKDIRYRNVQPAKDADAKPYLYDGKPIASPLSVHLFRGDRRNAKGEPLAALGELETLALEDCAQRIVELLNDPRHTINRHRVGPGDIAVLLTTNKQIVALRAILLRCGVPCVGSGRGSVFDTDVARELELILYAVLNAEDDRAVRGALATRLLGADLDDIRRWQEDEKDFERQLEHFAAWRELARRRGIMAVIDAMLGQRASVLLSAAQGERDVTDLRHLGELLAEQESARHGLEGLYAWYSSMRRESDDSDAEAADARQLRIESDGARVQLMTLHMSKGLEFPIVFLPVAWRISARDKQFKPKALYFHDSDGQPRVDLGSANFSTHLGHHFREDLQERLRLLYVALTRAVHAVHVYWVDRGERIDDDCDLWKRPAIDELIHQTQRKLELEQGEVSLGDLADRLAGMAIVPPADATGSRHEAPTAGDITPSKAKALPALRAFRWLHSFSALTRNAVAGTIETAATDENEADDPLAQLVENIESVLLESSTAPEDPRLLALDDWRGRRFGNAVHKVFENAAPGDVWPHQRDLLVAQLALQAVREQGATSPDSFEAVGRMVDRVRATDLGEGLRLNDLDASSRVAEFEFQFPVHVALADLREVCVRHGHADVIPARLSVTTLNGMLTGFADLVFIHAGRYHVLDYKTNRLGTHLDDFRTASLDAAMAQHHYDLQALIYTVALHRHLRHRLDGYTPEDHLGDSWYLFVRGVGLAPGLGVCRRHWSPALIEALDEAFAGAGVATA
ncbi:MAG TPA: UvrD-helicase domain-containing protein [Rudaea sp.]|nr:UvrD-helicase domain-containing protein [Rudaea sp.]